MLVGAEGAGLFQEAVHERGLAMINVRDDRDVSNVLHIVNDRFAHTAKVSAAPTDATGKHWPKASGLHCDGFYRAGQNGDSQPKVKPRVRQFAQS